MTSAFEIFRVEPEGTVRWLEAAVSLQQARNRARELAVRIPGAYVILDSVTGEKHIFELAADPSTAADPAGGGSRPQNLRPPRWQDAYCDVLKEDNLQELARKVNAAETAIFHRLQDLQIVAEDADERSAIQEALKVLLTVKTEKLNFPGLTQNNRRPDAAFSRKTVHNCPGSDV